MYELGFAGVKKCKIMSSQILKQNAVKVMIVCYFYCSLSLFYDYLTPYKQDLTVEVAPILPGLSL